MLNATKYAATVKPIRCPAGVFQPMQPKMAAVKNNAVTHCGSNNKYAFICTAERTKPAPPNAHQLAA